MWVIWMQWNRAQVGGMQLMESENFHNGQHAVSTHTNIERTSFSVPNQMDFGQITMVHGRCHGGVVSLEYKGYHDMLTHLHNTMV